MQSFDLGVVIGAIIVIGIVTPFLILSIPSWWTLRRLEKYAKNELQKDLGINIDEDTKKTLEQAENILAKHNIKV